MVSLFVLRSTRSWLIIILSVAIASDVVGAFLPLPSTHQHALSTSQLNSLVNSEDKSEQQNHQTSLSQQDEQKCWMLPRLYVGTRNDDVPNNCSLVPGSLVSLSSDQTHYLTNVMRIFKKRMKKTAHENVDNSGGIMTVGCIRIFDGENGEWLARVLPPSEEQESTSGKGRNKRQARTKKQNKDIPLVAQCILQLRPQTCNEDLPWILFVPLKKQPRMKILIEKCTELGVGRIVPVASDRMEGGALAALLGSGGKSNDSTLDAIYGGYSNSQENEFTDISFGKLEAQSIEAAEQCERLGIPLITNDAGLTECESSHSTLIDVRALVKQWCNDWDGRTSDSKKRVLMICRERGSDKDTINGRATVVPVLQALRDCQSCSFLIGPEGGWSEDEEKSSIKFVPNMKVEMMRLSEVFRLVQQFLEQKQRR